MSSDATLARPVRGFIVLLALLQGLLLYVADYGQRHGIWPFDELGSRVCWYTLVLTVPATMLLSVRDLRDRRYWQHAGLVFVAFAVLAAYAAWSATGASGLISSDVLGPFGFTAACALFIALPYLQCRLEHARWCAPYAELFEHAWQNALTAALTGLFIGISWGVLLLWAILFDLIKIHFFKDLFAEQPFVYLATGCMAGLGILIGRTQQRAVQVARQILLAIFKGLLPLLGFIAVLFIVSLPFTGLEPLWKTRSAAAILLWLVSLLLLFVNAVYQDGNTAPPYPRPLRWTVEAALCVLPVYAGLAIYAIALRVGQHGWTADRCWAMVFAALLLGYAVGYAIAVLRQRDTWLSPLKRINVVLSLVAILLVVLTNSPVLDPHRIGVASQVARLRDNPSEVEKFDLDYLRFKSGRRGHLALLALRDTPPAGADATWTDKVNRLLLRKGRWDTSLSESELAAKAVHTVEAARALVHVAPGAQAPDDTWFNALLDGTLPPGGCLQTDADCVLLSPDLDADGQSEFLLCDLHLEYQLQCRMSTREAGKWVQAGVYGEYGPHREESAPALRAGKIEVRKPRWSELEIAGNRIKVQDTR